VDSLLDKTPVISSQVISEYLNVMQRRFKVEKRKLIKACAAWLQDCHIQPVTRSTIELAVFLIDRYDFQLFDGIIVANALEADCGILYSSDMQNGLIVEKRLKIVDPFS
jgi:predicted nucleic acid-binding protein